MKIWSHPDHDLPPFPKWRGICMPPSIQRVGRTFPQEQEWGVSLSIKTAGNTLLGSLPKKNGEDSPSFAPKKDWGGAFSCTLSKDKLNHWSGLPPSCTEQGWGGSLAPPRNAEDSPLLLPELSWPPSTKTTGKFRLQTFQTESGRALCGFF